MPCRAVNQARIRREALAADKSIRNAPGNGCPEQMTQQITVPEPSVSVLGKRRMIGHGTGQIEATEPAIRKIEMHLFAKPAF